MDPDTCLLRILDAINDGDREEAIGSLEDLIGWLTKKGAMPSLPLVGHYASRYDNREWR